jgi:hypothetical protein
MNWIQQTSGVTNSLWGADMIDANTGWFVLGSGQVNSLMVRKQLTEAILGVDKILIRRWRTF